MHTRPLLLVPAFLLLCSPLPAADWTRFRGPDGTGVAADKDVPVKWADRDVLFKVKLPGIGHSSPIIVNNQVFLLSATPSERLVLCLDAATGKQLWARTVPGKVGKTHPKSSLASATPCSDGKQVYCVFWDGSNVGLFAYDLKGELVWKRDLGAFKSQHGPGFSPIVADGKVIVNNDQDGKAALQAFDARTGEPAWEVKRPAFRACYSTPFVNEQGPAGKELVVVSTMSINGYSLADGKSIWSYTPSFPVKPLRTVGSALMADGHLFVCSGDGDGSRMMFAVKLGGKGDITRTALAWELHSSTPYVPTVLSKEGHLYTVTDDGVAMCRESKTGKEVWRQRVSSGVSASPLLIDGKVYVVGDRGDVTVFAASPVSCNVLGKSSVGERVTATPAVANGRLYIRGHEHLSCVGRADQR